MDSVDAVLIIGGLVANWVLWLAAIVDIARMPGLAFQRAGRSKGATWVLVLLTGFVGGGYWFLRLRREVGRETQAAKDVALASARAW
jgi:hypothetical protein